MTQLINPTILVVGLGKMGGTLVNGWLAQDVDSKKIHVVEPNPIQVMGLNCKTLNIYQGPREININFFPDIILFAIKPQIMDMVVPEYERFKEKSTYISIAAGKNIAFFESLLGSDSSIIRTMPNTPASIGEGITIACGNRNTSQKCKNYFFYLFETLGQTEWINDENLMDAVTAVSGSGPAYVFLLAETLANAGEKAGLDKNMAQKLSIQTIIGSSLMLRSSQENPSVLRNNVTSPGGTTEAALSILMNEKGLNSLICEAVETAIKRSKALSN